MRKKILAILILGLLILSTFSALMHVRAESGSIYWGAWVGEMNRMPLSTIQSFEGQVGKGISIWNWIQWWEVDTDQYHDANFNIAWMDEARSHGAIPMVSWSPSAASKGNYENYDSILNGAWDNYLAAWGKASAQWGHPYFIRFMWEFTGSWEQQQGTYPWSNGNSPEKFVEMWQYVVSHVRAAGGTQISWVWCPANVGDSVSILRSVYPGDSYVDWVGTDVYPSKGESFSSAAEPELGNIRAVSSKPVMIPEVGDNFGEDSFWSNLLTNELPSKPYIKAVCIWQQPEAGYTVTDSNVLPTFKQAIASNYYATNTYNNVGNLASISQTLDTTPQTSPNQIARSTINPSAVPKSNDIKNENYFVWLSIVSVIMFAVAYLLVSRRRLRQAIRRIVKL